jgi:hypothetical protein
MNRIASNGPIRKDYVVNPFTKMVKASSQLWIASPYVTKTQELVEAAKQGKFVYLLVGLNSTTSPEALAAVHALPNCAVRYFTHRFHAKIYLFDGEALIGSSNLTEGGMQSNREGTICVDRADDLAELRSVFAELWDSAQVLTMEKLKLFTSVRKLMPTTPHVDPRIENAVGRAEPQNSNVNSLKKTRQDLFLEQLRREVYEQYRPSFTEVTTLLGTNDFRRKELADIGEANETNRFLNWVRLTYVKGIESWETAPELDETSRRAKILQLGQEWSTTDDDKIPHDYIDWLHRVNLTFGTKIAIADASKAAFTKGLLSLHAFSEQSRWKTDLEATFWDANEHDIDKAKRTISYLLHGTGDFIQRLDDVLNDPSFKLGLFGYFSALELYGTVKPHECPPMNGRMAKALRYLGFRVRAT